MKLNNKGFSLIEVLVTVGLIGILVGIAVPSYNSYRANTVKMAMKADLGNGSKVYNARYAVDSTYCYNFDDVGLNKDRDDNPIYKNKGFFGFGVVNASNCGGVTLTDVQFKSAGSGTCSDMTSTTQATCTMGGGTWTSDRGTEWTGGDPNNCELNNNAFKMGATTNVSNINDFIQADQDGKIVENPLAANLNCGT